MLGTKHPPAQETQTTAAARASPHTGPSAAADAASAARAPALPSLTGLRWVAALLVFGLHVRNAGYFGGTGGRIMTWGFGPGGSGVSFFFVLSGFVLMWSARPADRAFAFWRRRIARVYPVHLVTTALALLMAYGPGMFTMPTPRQGLANLLLVHSWWRPWWQTLDPVSWSLACEAFFYALFPALAFVLRRLGARGSAAVAGASALAVLALTACDPHTWLGGQLYSLPAARLPEFVLGAAVARTVLLGRWRGPGLEASLALTIIGYFLVPQITPGHSATACTLLGFALLIPAAAVADLRGLPSLWRHRRLVRLGELSFAFYMVHLLVVRAVRSLVGTGPRFGVPEGLALTAAVFAVSLGLAWVLYEGVERPARRLLLREGRRARADGTAPRARTGEPGATAARAGTPEAGAPAAGAPEARATQPCAPEARAPEGRAPEGPATQAGSAQASAAQAGSVQASAAQVSAAQASAAETGFAHAGSAKARAANACAAPASAAQVSAAKAGSAKARSGPEAVAPDA
ncbi:acyltransferase [Streptomyces sp. NPDC002265]|uniref:acyltransferase family protein n=1 Tax=Streptomyces sp. NPDC002265 TaxID=3154415 RepID=UPI0033174C62